MHFICSNNILFSTFTKSFCRFTLEQFIKKTQSLKMFNNRDNYLISGTATNANGNRQHRRASGNNIIPQVQSQRSRRGSRNQESINATFQLPNVQIHSQIFQQCTYDNGLIPNINPSFHQYVSTTNSTSLIQIQHNRNVSFHRGDIKSPNARKQISKSEERQWRNTKIGAMISSHNKKPGIFFSIMNYNVLAQDLLDQHPHVYVRNDKNALNWEHRWNNLLTEIKAHNCDILCLQEVQQSHISSHYERLQTLGYNGIYKQATGIKSDGCAIYYKTDKFKLIEFITVEYMQRDTNLLNRDNIALIAKFAPAHNLAAEFIVATTHLLYNPKREDVRLAQSQVLLAEVERMAYDPNKCAYLPIIITGDFNSTPNTTVYELFTKGTTNYKKVLQAKHSTVWISEQLCITENSEHANLLKYRERKEPLTRDDEYKAIRLRHSEKIVMKDDGENNCTNNAHGKINHKFILKSVYANNADEGTTFQDEWVIVDYMFYSAKKHGDKVMDGNLKLLSYYSLPKGNALQSMIIPNQVLGSDHLALIAKFKLEY